MSLAAVGCFLRAARDRGDRSALVGLALAVALTGWMRPPDAVWLVAPAAVVGDRAYVAPPAHGPPRP
jgi:hypothetical protein